MAWLLGQFGKKRGQALKVYRRFVHEGVNRESVWKDLKHQILLGDESFVGRVQGMEPSAPLDEIPKRQRRSAEKTLGAYQNACPDRDETTWPGPICLVLTA
jgi:REP-associated tyrosine transposase